MSATYENEYELGQAVALEQLARTLLKQAGEEFQCGNDDRARDLRNLVKMIENEASKHRKLSATKPTE